LSNSHGFQTDDVTLYLQLFPQLSATYATQMDKSHHTYEWVTTQYPLPAAPPATLCNICNAYGWIRSHIRRSHNTIPPAGSSCSNSLQHTQHIWTNHTYEWVITQYPLPAAPPATLCNIRNTYGRITHIRMSPNTLPPAGSSSRNSLQHIWTSHVTHMNMPRLWYEWVISPSWTHSTQASAPVSISWILLILGIYIFFTLLIIHIYIYFTLLYVFTCTLLYSIFLHVCFNCTLQRTVQER